MTKTVRSTDTPLERLETMVIFDRNERGQLQLWYSDRPDFQTIRHIGADPNPYVRDMIESGHAIPDKNFDRRMWLVPLGMELIPSDARWICSGDFRQATDAWRSILLSGCSFKTTETLEQSLLFALMSFPTEEQEYSRSGILFVRDQEGGFHPLTWKGEAGEFLIEGKGLGNPLCLRIKHHRLSGETMTGGIKTEEVLKEHYFINIMRQYSRGFAQGKRVRNLASTVSTLDPFANQFFRLSPTNRRASWAGNPIFPSMKEPAVVGQLAYALGEDVGEAFSLPKPFFHGSSHPENLLLFGKRDHCLTDFSNGCEAQGQAVNDCLQYSMEAVAQLDGFGGDITYFSFLRGLTDAFVQANMLSRVARTNILLSSDPKSALRKLQTKIGEIIPGPGR